MNETITWITDGSLPDSDTTVLVQDHYFCSPAFRSSFIRVEQIGEGFHDGEQWRWASSSLITGKVNAWAHLPSGPPVMR